MDKQQFDKEKIMDHWISNANDDYDTMIVMFGSKRYSWSLFLGHLVLEKLLKAYFVKVNDEYPPHIHNLLRLATDAKIEVSDDLKLQLTTISAFNINARYDDYKNSFRERCTPEFTTEWVGTIKKLKSWIMKQIEE